MLKSFISWLANTNFGYHTSRIQDPDLADPREFKPIWWIRRLQCNIFGHEWYCWTIIKKKDEGWCAWCARSTQKHPKMRARPCHQ